jgi:hypothetical protein
MGTDTKGFYPKVTREQMLNLVNALATSMTGPRDTSYKEYVTVNFQYKGEGRTLNIHDLSINQERDIKKWKSKNVDSVSYVKQGLPDKTKGTLTSLGFWGRSVELMKIFAYYFGGFVDEQDTDNKDFKSIAKNHHKLIALLFSTKLS